VNPRNQSFVVTFLLIVAAVAMVVMAVQRDSTPEESLTINEVAGDIQAGKISRVVIENDDTLRVIYNSGDEKESHKETNATFVEQLLGLGVTPEQLAPGNVKIEVDLLHNGQASLVAHFTYFQSSLWQVCCGLSSDRHRKQ